MLSASSRYDDRRAPRSRRRLGVLAAGTLGLCGLGLGMTSPAQASTICWKSTAPASGGLWSSAANWNGGVVPGAGDTAVLNGAGGACSLPSDVTVSGSPATVGLIQTAGSTVIVDGTTLTLTGVATISEILGSVNAKNGGHLVIATGASILTGSSSTLDATSSITVSGTLTAYTGGYNVTGGTMTVGPTGTLAWGQGNTGILATTFVNDGHIDVQTGGFGGGTMFITPSPGSGPSSGAIAVASTARIVVSPQQGQTVMLNGALSGAGAFAVQVASGGSSSGPAVVRLGGSAACAIANLDIFSPAALDLQRDCAVTQQLKMSGSGVGGRFGPATLTAASALLLGGQITGGGLTAVTGATTVSGGYTDPAIHGGATLRTDGATSWHGGVVQLGAPGEAGTWQNTGALTIDNASAGFGNPPLALSHGGGTGVLRNAAGATITRSAPVGAFSATARIENAGTVDITAGDMGSPAPAPTGAFVQSAGQTHVASGARLNMHVRLDGGYLRGTGTIADVDNAGGTVAPGNSPGTLNIAGPFSQGPAGALEEQIAATADSAFDRLIVGGAATLGGTLQIVTDAAFTPVLSGTFRILQAASSTGGFATLTGTSVGALTYVATYQADGATLCFAGASEGPCAGTSAPPPTTTPPPTATDTGGTPPATPAPSTPAPVASPGLHPASTAQAVPVDKIASLPTARTCASRRSFTIRLRVPRGVTAAQARVLVNGRPVKVIKSTRLKAPVNLVGLPKGRFSVTIELQTADGQILRGTRRYRTCTKKAAGKHHVQA
jgi:hypothetical protein